MRKIASPVELQEELNRLIAYTNDEHPSRAKLADALEDLSVRVASGGSLFDHKVEWALQLAEVMKQRFSGVGGWRDWRIESRIHRTRVGAAVGLTSEKGWACDIDINVEGQPEISVGFSVTGDIPTGLPDLDTLNLDDLLGITTRETFRIKEREPMAKGMMDVSLWLSKQVAPLSR